MAQFSRPPLHSSGYGPAVQWDISPVVGPSRLPEWWDPDVKEFSPVPREIRFTELNIWERQIQYDVTELGNKLKGFTYPETTAGTTMRAVVRDLIAQCFRYIGQIEDRHMLLPVQKCPALKNSLDRIKLRGKEFMDKMLCKLIDVEIVKALETMELYGEQAGLSQFLNNMKIHREGFYRLIFLKYIMAFVKLVRDCVEAITDDYFEAIETWRNLAKDPSRPTRFFEGLAWCAQAVKEDLNTLLEESIPEEVDFEKIWDTLTLFQAAVCEMTYKTKGNWLSRGDKYLGIRLNRDFKSEWKDWTNKDRLITRYLTSYYGELSEEALFFIKLFKKPEEPVSPVPPTQPVRLPHPVRIIPGLPTQPVRVVQRTSPAKVIPTTPVLPPVRIVQRTSPVRVMSTVPDPKTSPVRVVQRTSPVKVLPGPPTLPVRIVQQISTHSAAPASPVRQKVIRFQRTSPRSPVRTSTVPPVRLGQRPSPAKMTPESPDSFFSPIRDFSPVRKQAVRYQRTPPAQTIPVFPDSFFSPVRDFSLESPVRTSPVEEVIPIASVLTTVRTAQRITPMEVISAVPIQRTSHPRVVHSSGGKLAVQWDISPVAGPSRSRLPGWWKPDFEYEEEDSLDPTQFHMNELETWEMEIEESERALGRKIKVVLDPKTRAGKVMQAAVKDFTAQLFQFLLEMDEQSSLLPMWRSQELRYSLDHIRLRAHVFVKKIVPRIVAVETSRAVDIIKKFGESAGTLAFLNNLKIQRDRFYKRLYLKYVMAFVKVIRDCIDAITDDYFEALEAWRNLATDPSRPTKFFEGLTWCAQSVKDNLETLLEEPIPERVDFLRIWDTLTLFDAAVCEMTYKATGNWASGCDKILGFQLNSQLKPEWKDWSNKDRLIFRYLVSEYSELSEDAKFFIQHFKMAEEPRTVTAIPAAPVPPVSTVQRTSPLLPAAAVRPGLSVVIEPPLRTSPAVVIESVPGTSRGAASRISRIPVRNPARPSGVVVQPIPPVSLSFPSAYANIQSVPTAERSRIPVLIRTRAGPSAVAALPVQPIASTSSDTT